MTRRQARRPSVPPTRSKVEVEREQVKTKTGAVVTAIVVGWGLLMAMIPATWLLVHGYRWALR